MSRFANEHVRAPRRGMFRPSRLAALAVPG